VSVRGTRLVRGSVLRAGALFTEIAAAFVLLPVLKADFGDTVYGAWALVGSLLGFYGLLDLGIATAVGRFVARALGRADRGDADRHAAAAFWLCLAGGLGVFLVAAGSTLLVPLFFELSGPAVPMRAVLLVMGAGLAVSFPGRAFSGVLTAHVRYDVAAAARIAVVVVRVAAVLFAIDLGTGILGAAAATASVAALESVLLFLLARAVHGAVPFARPSRRAMGELLRFGGVSFLAQVADVVRFQAYSPVVAGALGLAAVTPFSFAFELTRRLARGMQALLSIMVPVFAHQDGRRDVAALRSSYFFSYRIAWGFGLLGATILWLFAPPFLERWLGPGHEDIAVLARILVVGVFAGVTQLPTVNLLFGTGRHRLYALSNSVEAALHVALALVLVRTHGLAGVAWASVAPMALSKLGLQPLWASRVLRVPLAEYHLRHTLPNLVAPGLFALAFALVAGPHLEPTYASLALWGAGATGVFCVYILFAGFPAEERRQILHAVRGLFPARRRPAG